MNGLTMRDEFEAWAAESLLEGRIAVEKLVRLRDGDNYSVISVNHNSARYAAGVLSAAWRSWQASRATLSVDLTVLSSKIRFADDEVCTGLVRYDEACAAIEAAGVNCK